MTLFKLPWGRPSGEPGVGKTTYGCAAPDAILIPTEDGSLGVKIRRLPRKGKCRTYDDVLAGIKVLQTEEHSFKTLVIDTLNGVETLMAQMVCNRDFGGHWQPSRGVEGYNSWARGPKATAQEMRVFLEHLDDLWCDRNMEIIILAHAGLLKSGNALGEDFMKFAPDIDKYSWAIVCGWADMVGHAARDVRVNKGQDKKFRGSAIGDERFLYWQGGPGRDAKARVGYEVPASI